MWRQPSPSLGSISWLQQGGDMKHEENARAAFSWCQDLNPGSFPTDTRRLMRQKRHQWGNRVECRRKNLDLSSVGFTNFKQVGHSRLVFTSGNWTRRMTVEFVIKALTATHYSSVVRGVDGSMLGKDSCSSFPISQLFLNLLQIPKPTDILCVQKIMLQSIAVSHDTCLELKKNGSLSVPTFC